MNYKNRPITLDRTQRCITLYTKTENCLQNMLRGSFFNLREDCLRMTARPKCNRTFFNRDDTYKI